MSDKKPSHVWYASYGSNLCRDRFMTYIKGGQAGARTYLGCRDQSEPKADMTYALPGQLYFAGESKVWTGGLAFVQPTMTGDLLAASRAYLITYEQFVDVVSQENWRDEPMDIDDQVAEAMANQTAVMGDGTGNYDLLWCPGEIDGVPVLTFTGPRVQELNTPSQAYLQMIGSGLTEIGVPNPHDYLMSAIGRQMIHGVAR